MTSSESVDICCLEFDPRPWEDCIFHWENKRFIRDHVCTVFHMPLNFGRVISKMNRKVEMSGAGVPDALCLSDHISGWRMDLYLAVDNLVPGANNLTLSGRYFSRVYEGAFKEMSRWINDFHEVARARELSLHQLYFWYTTCPKCARKYGKNYVVLIGGIS